MRKNKLELPPQRGQAEDDLEPLPTSLEDGLRALEADQGWKFVSYSHCQELGQQASWLLQKS